MRYWPLAMNTFDTLVAPRSGRSSGEPGRKPAQCSEIFQPSSSGSSAIARVNNHSSASSVGVVSKPLRGPPWRRRTGGAGAAPNRPHCPKWRDAGCRRHPAAPARAFRLSPERPAEWRLSASLRFARSTRRRRARTRRRDGARMACAHRWLCLRAISKRTTASLDCSEPPARTNADASASPMARLSTCASLGSNSAPAMSPPSIGSSARASSCVIDLADGAFFARATPVAAPSSALFATINVPGVVKPILRPDFSSSSAANAGHSAADARPSFCFAAKSRRCSRRGRDHPGGRPGGGHAGLCAFENGHLRALLHKTPADGKTGDAAADDNNLHDPNLATANAMRAPAVMKHNTPTM